MFNDKVVELKIQDVLSNDEYSIPIYQRNYAWEEVEIQQLIEDIFGHFKSKNPQNYYLGSLVVSKIKGKENFYEVIDGQQRLTTLTVIVAVLQNEYLKNDIAEDEKIRKSNISFQLRKSSLDLLNAMYSEEIKKSFLDSEYLITSTEENSHILEAYKIAKKKLDDIFRNPKYKSEVDRINKLKIFFKNLTSNVILLRVLVPENTDLNHYFEIMNTRGEQLEKHQILKARLMAKLDAQLHSEKDSKKTELKIEATLHLFGYLWDAISDMNLFVKHNLDSNLRVDAFGVELQEYFSFAETLQKYCRRKESENSNRNNTDDIPLKENNSKVESPTLTEFLKDFKTGKKFDPPNKEILQEEKYKSVINFPNFLLHALRILFVKEIRNKIIEDISLDDKKLLDLFTQYEERINPIEFLQFLMNLRILYDNYIIKRQKDDTWILQSAKQYNNKQTKMDEVNSFTDQINDHVIKLISMMHVSFPQMIYKNWLSGVLLFLWNDYFCLLNLGIDGKKPRTYDLDGNKYILFLEKLVDNILFRRFSSDGGEEYEKIVLDLQEVYELKQHEFDKNELNQGVSVQNFIFNRLEYLLWKINSKSRTKKIAEKLSTEIVYLRVENVNNFYFTFRSSVEHFYPQHPEDHMKLEDNGDPGGLHSFGNLCLLRRETNSRFGNLLPNTKCNQYPKYLNESLKLQLMNRYSKEWGPNNKGVIIKHQEVMEKILLLKCHDV